MSHSGSCLSNGRFSFKTNPSALEAPSGCCVAKRIAWSAGLSVLQRTEITLQYFRPSLYKQGHHIKPQIRGLSNSFIAATQDEMLELERKSSPFKLWGRTWPGRVLSERPGKKWQVWTNTQTTDNLAPHNSSSPAQIFCFSITSDILMLLTRSVSRGRET